MTDNTMVQCHPCRGTGGFHFPASEVLHTPAEDWVCPFCQGTGQMAAQQAEDLEEWAAAQCNRAPMAVADAGPVPFCTPEAQRDNAMPADSPRPDKARLYR